MILLQIGPTGTMSKSFTNLRPIWKARNQGTTETSHVGHCTHNLESADVNEYKTLNVGSNITCSMQCNCNTTHHRIMVCFRHAIANTLHEGENKINNYNNNILLLLLLLLSTCLLTYWLDSKNTKILYFSDRASSYYSGR